MKTGGLKSLVESRRSALVCVLLAAVTFGVYWQVTGFEFTNYDEFQMVLRNPHVLGGLTPQGLWWGLTTTWFECYWHPLTWWSHMLDCELFGVDAGWHHLVSLGFHAASTVLVFVVLRRMTGALWRSAVVAALFGLHPLHVESVVWIAERKDVLSGFFFILTLWAYVRYAGNGVTSNQSSVISDQTSRAPATGNGLRTANHRSLITDHRLLFYLLSLFFFALGLMSKPMVVTLPFVLLLLDYWPLQRLSFPPLHHSNAPTLQRSTIPPLRLIWEKLPFFLLAAAVSSITYLVEKAGGNLLSAETMPWGRRLANVPLSYAWYVGKTIWPADLIVRYQMASRLAWWEVSAALLLLVVVSVIVAVRARSAPYLIVGWLIFLGTLVPVIGLVPGIGTQAIADRYSYIPSIGLFVAVVWGIAEGSGRWKWRRVWVGSAAGLALAACGWLTWVQAGYWRNSFTLWTHCLAVSPDNVLAHYNLGYFLQHSNRTSEAIEQYRATLRLMPEYPGANLNLGIALIGSGRAQESTNYLAVALRTGPDFARVEGAMGLALRELGDYAGAVAHCGEAIRLDPGAFGPYVDMGRALSAQGKSDEALGYYAEGLRLNPAIPQTHYYLGLEWMKRGMFEQAAASFGEAVRLAPGFAEARAQQQRALNEIKQPQMNTDEHR